MNTEITAPERSADLIRIELKSLREEIKSSGRIVEWLQAVTREFIRLQPDLAPEIGVLQSKLQASWEKAKEAINNAKELDQTLLDTFREFDAERGDYARKLRILARQTDTAPIGDILEERIAAGEHDPVRPFGKSNDSARLDIPNGYELPKGQALPTFLEARETALSISNGRDLKWWSQLEGIEAMLHKSPVRTAKFDIRFFPSALFQQWHGTAGVDVQTRELQNCDFDSVLLFYACLSWALESPGMRVNTSLDALISAIGQDENARQGEREELREKVWRDLLIFDSQEVIGARGGTWREAAPNGEKRAKMDGGKLHSSDALLRILGHRDSDSNVPKEVTLVVGEWAAQFQGNREVLADFGNLRLLAAIPARRAAGAWARCIGVGLFQHWRQQSSKAAPITHKNSAGEVRSQTLKFKAITRRELLLSTLRPNHDVQAILDGNDPQRAKIYWEKAIELLQNSGVIGYYKELKPITANRWKADWLDQPLDIRPKDDALNDARKINTEAVKARGRKPVSRKK